MDDFRAFSPPLDPARAARASLFSSCLEGALLLRSGLAARLRPPAPAAIAAALVPLALSGAAFAQDLSPARSAAADVADTAAWLAEPPPEPVHEDITLSRVQIDVGADGRASVRYTAWQTDTGGAPTELAFHSPPRAPAEAFPVLSRPSLSSVARARVAAAPVASRSGTSQSRDPDLSSF